MNFVQILVTAIIKLDFPDIEFRRRQFSMSGLEIFILPLDLIASGKPIVQNENFPT